MKTKKLKGNIKIILLTILLISVSITLVAAERAYMGVYTSDWNTKSNPYAEDYDYGIIITKVVKDGPAQKAGVENKDLLLELDNEKVYTNDQLTKMLQNYEPGNKVKITVVKVDGDKQNLKIKLGSREDVNKTPKRAFLGINVNELDADDYEELEIDKQYGLEVERVLSDSPAQEAGIEEEDVIMKLDGENVYTESQFSQMIKNYKPKDNVTLTVWREGNSQEIDVVLGEAAYRPNRFLDDIEIPESVFMYKYKKEHDKGLGITVTTITEESKVGSVESGVIITKVLPDSPAETAELIENDIITKADGGEIEDVGDLKDVIEEKEIGETVNLQIVRGKNLMTKDIKVEKLPESARKMNRVNMFLDDGEIKMEINGEETTILEFNKMFEGLEKLKNLKELEKLEAIEELEDLEFDKKEKELKIKLLSKEKGLI